jgi:hypothetical protein
MVKYEISVLICCLARDCEKAILDNIPRIEQLRKYFKYSEVFIVENDSKDKTTEILDYWQKEYNGVYINSFFTSSLTLPYKSNEHPYPGSSLYRITKLALYRNMYLDWLEKNKDKFDLLIVIDADIKFFSIKGVVKAILKAPLDWGGIFANGYTDVKFFRWRIYTMFHDMYAYLEELPDGKPYQTIKKLFDKKKLMKSKLRKREFLPVISAFGGIGIYKINAINGLRYTAEPNGDKYIEAVCEHIPFNIEIIKRGYSNYVNSKMYVYYGISDFKIVLRNLLPLKLFKFICILLTFKKLKE